MEHESSGAEHGPDARGGSAHGGSEHAGVAVAGTGRRWSRRAMVRRAGIGMSAAGTGVVAACGLGAPQGGRAPAPSTQTGEVTWYIADHNQDTRTWLEQTLNPSFVAGRPKVQVSMIYTAFGAEFDEKRDALYAAGNGPDILQSGASYAAVYALKKMAVPMDDRLKQWKDWSDFYPNVTATAKFADKQYGIPSRIDARTMVYRKDLFDQRGLALPNTWDEMRTAALALSRREGDEVKLIGYDTAAFNYQSMVWQIWQNGGEWLSPDGRKAVFNSPEAIDAVQFWADLIDATAPAGTTVPPAPTGLSRLAAGGAAAHLTNQGVIVGAMRSAPDVVPKLVSRPPLTRRKQIVNGFNNWFGIGSQGKVPDLAWELLQHFGKPEHILRFSETHSAVVPRRSLRETGYMADPRYQMPVWIEVIEKYARPQPVIPLPAQSLRIGDEVAASVLTRKMTAKQALDDGVQRWQALLDEGYRGL